MPIETGAPPKTINFIFPDEIAGELYSIKEKHGVSYKHIFMRGLRLAIDEYAEKDRILEGKTQIEIKQS